MASDPEKGEVYFPELQYCLQGGAYPILSWRQIATAVSDISGERQAQYIVGLFFKDPQVKPLIAEPTLAFAPPTKETTSDFETRISKLPDWVDISKYDIGKLKEHAQWLSGQARLGLVAALRIVLIELQTRGSAHLAGPLSSQDVANLREAAGLGNGQDSVLLSTLGSVGAGDAESLWTRFEDEESVKLRIFDTYLSERRHFTMALDYLHSLILYQRLPITTASEAYATSDFHGISEPPTVDSTLRTYLKTMEKAMENIEAGVEAVATDEDLRSESVAMEWNRTALVEVAHSLSIIFQSLDTHRKEFAPSALVGEWFSLMEVYAFFDKLEPINEQIGHVILHIKALVSAISLLLIRPNESLLYLDGDRDDSPSNDDAYLTQSDVLEVIHGAVVNAANLDCESAAPVIFAWTLVAHRMYVSLNERLERRDNLLHQTARETFEGSMSTNMRTTSGRRNSAGSMMSIETLKFDSFLQGTGLDKDLHVIEQLAKVATGQGRVFDVMTTLTQVALGLNHTSLTPLLGHRIRTVYLDFLKACYPVIGYQSDSVSCLVAVLTMGRPYADQSPVKPFATQHNITDVALVDQVLLRLYVTQSLDRFPFELLPFVKLCRALCSGSPTGVGDDRAGWIVSLLGRTPTLTLVLPANFQNFEMPPEEENTNAFFLTRDLALISSLRGMSHGNSRDFRIPAGTMGKFVADSGRVVLMQFEHSGLGLLGRRLDMNLSKESCHLGLGPLEPGETAEVIALIADLVRMEYIKATASGVPALALLDPERNVLSEASRYIGGSRDIISVVCDTMDFYLQEGQATEDDVGITVLQSCVQFLQSILPQSPSSVWSYMSRCELLNSESQAGKLGKIVGELDLILERYEFLLATVRLWSSMIDAAMTSAVQRRCGNQFAYRQRARNNPWLGVADRVLERVCHSMVQATIDVFENSATWRYSSEFDRIVLTSELVPILTKVVTYAYGMDGDKQQTAAAAADKLTCCLSTAASYIVDAFLSSSTGSLRFQAILGAFASTFKIASTGSTLFLPHLHKAIASQLGAVVGLVRTLLRVSVYRSLSSVTLESRLFKSSTLLARLSGISSALKAPALQLLEALVSTAGKAEPEPPSLLGYIGIHASKSFLQTLAMLGPPVSSWTDEVSSWKLFSAIVSNRQQWMANCLLTGKTPREGLRNEQGIVEPSTDSALHLALKNMMALEFMEPPRALAMLEFVTTALNYWPRGIMMMQQNDYAEEMQAYVRSLCKPTPMARANVAPNMVDASVKARLAAYIAQIIAMQLYHLRQMGKGQARATALVADLDYYLRDAANVSGYNKSLHANFAKNFAERYPGCTLESFKRTPVGPRDLGTSFYFDLERANDMLGFDPGWPSQHRNGFRAEMELANANLSLVDSQVALFNSWRVLLLELSCFREGGTPLIALQMLQVTKQCLDANQNTQGPEAIFTRIVESRAELALVLVQRLTGMALSGFDFNELLGNIVATYTNIDEPFSARSISYSRTLLKLMYVTLRAFTIGQALPGAGGDDDASAKKKLNLVSITQTVLSLVERVVARGFRTLVGFIHDADTSVAPEDLSILTAILQASLCMPDMEQSQTPVLNIMATHDTPRVAASLFSWADKLTIDGDPIYGELSLLFLLELSKLPVVAEQLACDGVLGNIMSANIIKYMLRNTISATAENPVAQRCYGIWAKGMLPLMLNLLTAMGGTIAPEVAYVLNQFPRLLKANVDVFEAPGVNRTTARDPSRFLTLLAVSELHSLALLTRILGALRVNNTRDIADVAWDAPLVLENVEFWLSTRRLLRERLLPMGSRELDWAGMPTGRTNPDGQQENKLEERVVCQLEAVRDVLIDDDGGE